MHNSLQMQLLWRALYQSLTLGTGKGAGSVTLSLLHLLPCCLRHLPVRRLGHGDGEIRQLVDAPGKMDRLEHVDVHVGGRVAGADDDSRSVTNNKLDQIHVITVRTADGDRLLFYLRYDLPGDRAQFGPVDALGRRIAHGGGLLLPDDEDVDMVVRFDRLLNDHGQGVALVILLDQIVYVVHALPRAVAAGAGVLQDGRHAVVVDDAAPVHRIFEVAESLGDALGLHALVRQDHRARRLQPEPARER